MNDLINCNFCKGPVKRYDVQTKSIIETIFRCSLCHSELITNSEGVVTYNIIKIEPYRSVRSLVVLYKDGKASRCLISFDSMRVPTIKSHIFNEINTINDAHKYIDKQLKLLSIR